MSSNLKSECMQAGTTVVPCVFHRESAPGGNLSLCVGMFADRMPTFPREGKYLEYSYGRFIKKNAAEICKYDVEEDLFERCKPFEEEQKVFSFEWKEVTVIYATHGIPIKLLQTNLEARLNKDGRATMSQEEKYALILTKLEELVEEDSMQYLDNFFAVNDENKIAFNEVAKAQKSRERANSKKTQSSGDSDSSDSEIVSSSRKQKVEEKALLEGSRLLRKMKHSEKKGVTRLYLAYIYIDRSGTAIPKLFEITAKKKVVGRFKSSREELTKEQTPDVFVCGIGENQQSHVRDIFRKFRSQFLGQFTTGQLNAFLECAFKATFMSQFEEDRVVVKKIPTEDGIDKEEKIVSLKANYKYYGRFLYQDGMNVKLSPDVCGPSTGEFVNLHDAKSFECEEFRINDVPRHNITVWTNRFIIGGS